MHSKNVTFAGTHVVGELAKQWVIRMRLWAYSMPAAVFLHYRSLCHQSPRALKQTAWKKEKKENFFSAEHTFTDSKVDGTYGEWLWSQMPGAE